MTVYQKSSGIRECTFLVIIFIFAGRNLDALGLYKNRVPRGSFARCSSSFLSTLHQQRGRLGWGVGMSRSGTEVGNFFPSASNVFGCQGLIGGEMDTSSSFPTDASREARSNLEESAGRGAFIGTEEDDCGRDEFRLKFGNLQCQT